MKFNQYIAKLLIPENEYNKMLTHMQELESFRNKIKGKPTLEEAIQLLNNSEQINFYKFYLYHSPVNYCDCRRCKLIEQKNIEEGYEQKLNKILERYNG